jgi:HSP20 family protein
MTPGGLMTGLPLPAPFLEAFRDAMERLSDGPLAPALDLYAKRDAIVAKVALPGVNPENVDVTVGDGLVTVCGSDNDEGESTRAGYVHRELSHGVFGRSFWLPTTVNAEAATATLKDGLLTLTLPKTEERKAAHVKVQVS